MKKARKLPNFFIVGAPRCGTTSMYTYLKKHPDVFMPDLKEPHLFDADFPVGMIQTWDDYTSLFEPVEDEKRIGEASTGYLYSFVAAENIRNYNPQAKIIIMLRDPVEMVYSWHRELLRDGRETIEDFRKAWQAESERRMGKQIPKRAIKRGSQRWLYYKKIADYAPQVERYINRFSRNNLCIIKFDDFVNNPENEYSKVLSYLDLPFENMPEVPRMNQNTVSRISWLHRWHGPLKSKLIDFLPSSLLNRFAKWNQIPKNRDALPTEFEAELYEYFRPRVKRLEELLDEKLCTWKHMGS